MKKTLLAACIGVCFAAPAVQAEPMTAEQEGLMLMDRAGEMRMLTQRLLRRACYISSGADLGLGDATSIDRDVTRMDETIAILVDGTEEIAPQRAPRTTMALRKLLPEWEAYAIYARFAERGEMPMAYLNVMANSRPGMIDALEGVVSAMGRTYGHGRLDPYSASAVNTTARLRMLSNLIAVEHCLIEQGADVASNDALSQAITRFQTDIRALSAGDDSRRIAPPSDTMRIEYQCVAARLGEVTDAVLVQEVSVAGLRRHTKQLQAASDAALQVLTAELTDAPGPGVSACDQHTF